MTLLQPNALECLLLAVALACALLVQPWKLLAYGGRHDLLLPLLAGLVLLPCAWWWPGPQYGGLAALVGANLLLLTAGWPLAMPVFALAGVWGWMIGASDMAGAGAMAFWRGVLPATLALAGGWAVRRFWGERVHAYLLGRAFFVPLGAAFCAALLDSSVRDAFHRFSGEAGSVLLLMSLVDAMTTVMAVSLLVVAFPRCLATWSDTLYLADGSEAARVLAGARKEAA